MEFKEAVRSQLGLGKSKAVPGKLLAQRLNEKDTRNLRLAIQDLIEEGIPIIGNSSCGYYIAENQEDCEQNLEYLKSYLKMIGKHYKYLKRASRKILNPEQLSMRL